MTEGDSRFRWTVAVLSGGLVAGAYVDAWARTQPSDPIVPWQDAPPEAGWLLVTGFLAFVFGRRLAAGAPWREALPPGYQLALAGALIFGVGALADVYYQLYFKVASGLEALLAPTHLVELAGGGMLVAAPLSRALSDRPERVGWPIVLSAAWTLSALTFFTLFIHPLSDLWGATGWRPLVSLSWVAQDLGAASIMVQVSVLTGLMLLLVRSFALPRGSLTAVCMVNGLCVEIVGGHPELLVVPLVTGLVADALLLRLRPDERGTSRLRIFSTVVPAVYTAAYWGAIVLFEGGTWWPGRLWLGLVMASALSGFLVSYVAGIQRPRSVVAEEVWAEVWPQRHVEVTPATVKAALDVLDDRGALAASPLARLPYIAERDGELRALLVDIVQELAAARAPRDAEAGRLLVDYYVKKVGSHEVIAERLHLSRPTFYRRLQRGLTLTAERLDELAEFAARHPA